MAGATRGRRRRSRRGARLALLLGATSGCAGGFGSTDEGPPGYSSGNTESSSTSSATGSATSTGPATSATGSATSGVVTTGGTSQGATTSGGTSGGVDCDPMWRTPLPNVILEGAALDPTGPVYLVGNQDGGGGRVQGLDPCDGSKVVDVAVDLAGATSTTLGAIAVDGGDVWVAGSVVTDSDPGDGYWSHLTGSGLTQQLSAPLLGGAGQDGVHAIAVNSTGRWWMGGGTDVAMGDPTTWMIRAQATGDACGFPWGMAGSGSVEGVVTISGKVYGLVDTTDSLVVLRYPDDDCTCGCMPDLVSDPIVVGSQETHVTTATVASGQIYAAGYARDTPDPSDIYGFLVWISPALSEVQRYTFNATAAGDGYLALAADDDFVFAGGLDGWTGADNFTDSTGRLDAFALPLAVNPQPVWSGAPESFDYVAGLTLDAAADGGLYVAGNIDAQGVVARCDKSGVCG